MDFSLDTTYVAFGDGSETLTGCWYGLAFLPEQFVNDAVALLESIKTKYGGEKDSPWHGWMLLHRSRRDKSPWSHLDVVRMSTMCGEFMSEMEKFSPLYLAGYTPKENFPSQFRLIGKNGHKDVVHPIDNKYVTLQIYQRLASRLDPEVIDSPTDPKVTKSPTNEPWWRLRFRRAEPGIKVRSIYLDREHDAVHWFSKKFQWANIAKEVVIARPGFPDSYLPVELAPKTGDKHPLLEWADLFIFSLGNNFRGGTMKLGTFAGNTDIEIFGEPGQEIVIGGDPQPSTKEPLRCIDLKISADGSYERSTNLLQLEMRLENGQEIVVKFEGDEIKAFKDDINQLFGSLPHLGNR